MASGSTSTRRFLEAARSPRRSVSAFVARQEMNWAQGELLQLVRFKGNVNEHLADELGEMFEELLAHVWADSFVGLRSRTRWCEKPSAARNPSSGDVWTSPPWARPNWPR